MKASLMSKGRRRSMSETESTRRFLDVVLPLHECDEESYGVSHEG